MGERSVLETVVGEIVPGLPLVISGPDGSGRTVLCLELAHRWASAGRQTVYATLEPPGLVLRQAASLGLDLERLLRDERLVLLEPTPQTGTLVRTLGVQALLEEIATEAPEAELLVVDPLSLMTSEVLDPVALRTFARGLFEAPAGCRRAVVATVDAGDATHGAGLERVLKEVCGSFVELASDDTGRPALRVAKSRAAGFVRGEVPFTIGPEGIGLLEPGGPVPADAITDGERQASRSTPARAARVEADAPVDARPATGDGDRPRVLVVEDDADLRERMRRWLAPRYDVALADNGFAAVTELVAHRPHLVILELRLPRIDGYEVLRAIRGRGVPTPVLVASSGLARAADRVRVLVLGANDLLAKPVQKFELLQKVDALVRQAPVAPATYDVEDVEALLSGASSLRVLDTSTFRERVDRACRFGEEYGLPSVLLAIATPSEKQCKRLIDAGPTVLRAEDAVVALPGDRALFLLVSTDTSVVPMILERFTRAVRRAGGSVEGMRWHAEVAVEGGAPGDWDALFGGLADWPEDQEPDRRRARAR